MTIEEYFYLDHYLEHYSIIFHNHKMIPLVEKIIKYMDFLFMNKRIVSFEDGKEMVEYFYNKALPFDCWSKPTFRIDEPIPFA